MPDKFKSFSDNKLYLRLKIDGDMLDMPKNRG